MADSITTVTPNTSVLLELENNNLYRNGRLLVFPVEGEMALVREKYVTIGSLDDQYCTVTAQDRLDVLAWKYYRGKVEDPGKFWWVIADANNIFNPLDWVGDWLGKDLLIPDILGVLLILDNLA